MKGQHHPEGASRACSQSSMFHCISRRSRRISLAACLTFCALISYINLRYGAMQRVLDGDFDPIQDVDSKETRSHRREFKIWPEDDSKSDRIMDQLLFYDNATMSYGRTLRIHLPHGLSSWNVQPGQAEFAQCPANNCEFTDTVHGDEIYDAAIFRNSMTNLPRHHSDQIWIYYTLESPHNAGPGHVAPRTINWTATYRHDSDIVAPYEKFVLFDSKLAQNDQSEAPAMLEKTGKVKIAWFVSNCFTNNMRMEYAKQLMSHLDVDVYGSCGSKQCSKLNQECFNKLKREYKFYLAFENSNCRDYITEKFFLNALQNNIIPVVMGATKEDYERAAPPHSYIHVEDFSGPQELADYLRILDQNRTMYEEYFAWRTMGTFINTKFWCRLCALLNTPKRKSYENVDLWWRGPQTCISGRWDSLDERKLQLRS